jgi:hypothetical protein
MEKRDVDSKANSNPCFDKTNKTKLLITPEHIPTILSCLY